LKRGREEKREGGREGGRDGGRKGNKIKEEKINLIQSQILIKGKVACLLHVIMENEVRKTVKNHLVFQCLYPYPSKGPSILFA
jgi:DNA invertase Pin-like site-specific DNA recombinase